jgi:hypothetical protein
LPNAALLVIGNPPEVCCRIGFDAVPLKRTDLPAGVHFVGDACGLPVAIEPAIVPEGQVCLTLGVDADTGLLMATLLGG